MASIGLFLKHIKLTPEKMSGELLYIHNFLSLYGFDQNQLLNQGVLDEFVNFTGQSEYWLNKKEALFNAFKIQLESFYQKHPGEIDVARFKKNFDEQVISIENSIDHMTVVSKHIKKQKINNNKKIKLKNLSDKQVMALILDQQNNLEVRIYSNRAKIVKGSLSSLSPVSRLFYNSHMEFQASKFQKLLVSGTFYSFKSLEDRVLGFAISNKNFQLKEKLSCPLNHECILFYPLKSIEKHFIDLSSDPFYTQLCGNIDKAVDALKLKQPESLVFAKKAIKSAYLALKYVFDDDNYLKYKLLELERTIQAEVQWVEQSQNHLQN